MKTFKLNGQVTVSSYTTVTAETLKEAIHIAENREAAIGGSNTGISENEFWVIDDADGMAYEICEDV